MTYYKSAKDVALDNAAAELGQDFERPYLDEWQVPVEGVNFPVAELSPETIARLDAWRAELSLYIQRQHARRKRRKQVRRRRIAALASSAALSLAGVGAAAHALGVEVPVVDDAVEMLLAGRQPVRGPRAAVDHDGPLPGVQRGNPASERLEVPSAAGDSTVSAVAYQAVRPQVCFRVIDLAPGAAANELVTGCWPFGQIARIGSTGPAVVSSITIGKTTILTGFASTDVETIEGRGPDASLQTVVSATWTPDPTTLPGFRVFIATTEIATGDDGLDIGEETRARDLRSYQLRAVLTDGSTVAMQP